MSKSLRERRKWLWTMDVDHCALYWFIMFSSSLISAPYIICHDLIPLLLLHCLQLIPIINVMYLSLFSQCIQYPNLICPCITLSAMICTLNLFAFDLLIYWGDLCLALWVWLCSFRLWCWWWYQCPLGIYIMNILFVHLIDFLHILFSSYSVCCRRGQWN